MNIVRTGFSRTCVNAYSVNSNSKCLLLEGRDRHTRHRRRPPSVRSHDPRSAVRHVRGCGHAVHRAADAFAVARQVIGQGTITRGCERLEDARHPPGAMRTGGTGTGSLDLADEHRHTVRVWKVAALTRGSNDCHTDPGRARSHPEGATSRRIRRRVDVSEVRVVGLQGRASCRPRARTRCRGRLPG